MPRQGHGAHGRFAWHQRVSQDVGLLVLKLRQSQKNQYKLVTLSGSKGCDLIKRNLWCRMAIRHVCPQTSQLGIQAWA